MTNIIDSASLEILKKYFNFDKIFDLAQYDTNIEELFNDLAVLKKESYESNYRFIFLHYDTDYYVSNDTPGVTLRNLQKILSYLDIPNYFCLILTQQYLDHQLKWLQKNETTDDTKIDSITYYNYYIIDKVFPNELRDKVDISPESINSKYLTLNRVRRFHRHVLISLLREKNLLDQGLVSYTQPFVIDE